MQETARSESCALEGCFAGATVRCRSPGALDFGGRKVKGSIARLALAYAVLLLSAVSANAASNRSAASAPSPAGTIYEWVDDSGRMHASDTVPEKYKGVAKRVDPSRSQIPAAQQAEAQRQAAALKANAASAAPAPVGSVAQTDGTRRAARGASAPSASECVAWRQRFKESQDCFIGFSNPDGSRGYHSCANEVVPDPEPVCGPAGH